jgi:hypothetical protein
MKRVYTTDSVAMAWHMRNVLEQHDIDAEVRNANLFSVAGELPIHECQPEVWVRPLDFRRAEQIIRELELTSSERQDGPEWICGHCQENNYDNFDICWNCQNSRATAGD